MRTLDGSIGDGGSASGSSSSSASNGGLSSVLLYEGAPKIMTKTINGD